MNDLIDRLRGHVSPSWGSAGIAMREAADEMEALREQLRLVRVLVESVRDANARASASGDRFHLLSEPQRVAWNALMAGLEWPTGEPT